MDDDAPLSSLAKAPKMDDDTPLAALAGKSKSTASPAKGGLRRSSSGLGAEGSGPKVAASPRPGAPKRKAGPPESSDSDSSDSSDSDSSSSSDDKPLAMKAMKGKFKKMRTSDDFGEDGEEDYASFVPVKTKDRMPKELVVAELLCRWWYALPDWPPSDMEYYRLELKKAGYRPVTIQEWEWVPEVDNGLKKAYGLSQYRGMYRSSAGELLDMRPKETCPCYSNFMKKELPELYDLLVTAYENQIKDLANSKYDETTLEAQLKAHLVRVRDKAYQAKSMGSTKRSRTSSSAALKEA